MKFNLLICVVRIDWTCSASVLILCHWCESSVCSGSLPDRALFDADEIVYVGEVFEVSVMCSVCVKVIVAVVLAEGLVSATGLD